MRPVAMINPSPTAFCIVYAATLFLSFFICVPMGLNLNDFDRKCVLSASGNWNSSDDLDVSWGPSSNCNFIIFMGIASMFTSIFFVWRSVVFVCKGYDGTPLYSFISMLSGLLITVSLFCCSFITSIGYSAWCDLLMSQPSKTTEVCWKVNLDKFGKKYHVVTEDFSSDLEIAEFGAWASSLAWLTATVLSFLKVRYYHKNEELLQGLAFEKDSLVPHRLHYQRIGDEPGAVS